MNNIMYQFLIIQRGPFFFFFSFLCSLLKYIFDFLLIDEIKSMRNSSNEKKKKILHRIYFFNLDDSLFIGYYELKTSRYGEIGRHAALRKQC